MSETTAAIIGMLVGGLIGTGVVVSFIFLHHYLWLCNFRRENRIAKEKWEA